MLFRCRWNLPKGNAGYWLVLLLISCTTASPGSLKRVGEEDEGTVVLTLPNQSLSEQLSPTWEASPLPIAARVEDEVILLEDYEKEVLRYEAGLNALGWEPATHDGHRITVLEQMINESLILQAAYSHGHTLTESELEAPLDESIAALGGDAGFEEWLRINQYTRDEFRQELHDQLLASMIQAEIVSDVPERAEQVHARHILVGTMEEAESLMAQLQSGEKFAALALEHSLDQSTRINGGDLGWFPRGFLTVIELERVAFGQELGHPSGIINTFLGFHIIETLERDPDRVLSPEAYIQLQQASVESWLVLLHEQADIQRYVH